MWGSRNVEDLWQLLYHQNGKCQRCKTPIGIESMYPTPDVKGPQYGLHAVCRDCWEQFSSMVILPNIEKFWRNQ